MFNQFYEEVEQAHRKCIAEQNAPILFQAVDEHLEVKPEIVEENEETCIKSTVIHEPDILIKTENESDGCQAIEQFPDQDSYPGDDNDSSNNDIESGDSKGILTNFEWSK